MGFVKATPSRIISFEFMGGLLLLAVSLAPLPRLYAEIDTNKGECSYILEVKTACVSINPGTGDHVRVRFMDLKGSKVTNDHLKDPIEVRKTKKSKPFKYCATAKFNISGPCLEGEVCSLHFKVEGDDNWKVEHAQVHGDNVSGLRCGFHKTLPAKTWWGYDLCNPDKERASSVEAYSKCNSENERGNGNVKNKGKQKAKRIKFRA